MLVRFQKGERRFVFAAPRAGGTLVELLDGTATVRRAVTRATLTCPVMDCSTPAITTVSRVRARDGYKHFATNAAEHKPESLFHLEGKAQIARWLRARHPGAEVVEELRTDAAGTRVADVLATFNDGRRVAIEIQYAPLAPEKWTERHESYRAQGIVDLWLFGHVGGQLHGRNGMVRLNPTHHAVLEAGLPLLWFNPLQLQIGRVTNSKSVRLENWTVHGDEPRARFEAEALDGFYIDSTGIVSERSRELDAATAEWQAARDHLLAQIEERRAQEAAREAERLASEAQRIAQEESRRAELSARQAEIDSQRARAEAARAAQVVDAHSRREEHRVGFASWTRTREGERAVAEFPDWPSWLDVDTVWSSTASPRVWQWWVWDRLLRGRAGVVDAQEILSNLARAFHAHFGNEQHARSAVFTFSRGLEDAGVLQRVDRGRWIVVGLRRQ